MKAAPAKRLTAEVAAGDPMITKSSELFVLEGIIKHGGPQVLVGFSDFITSELHTYDMLMVSAPLNTVRRSEYLYVPAFPARSMNSACVIIANVFEKDPSELLYCWINSTMEPKENALAFLSPFEHHLGTQFGSHAHYTSSLESFRSLGDGESDYARLEKAVKELTDSLQIR